MTDGSYRTYDPTCLDCPVRPAACVNTGKRNGRSPVESPAHREMRLSPTGRRQGDRLGLRPAGGRRGAGGGIGTRVGGGAGGAGPRGGELLARRDRLGRGPPHHLKVGPY